MPAAARLHDPIEHSQAMSGLIVGAVLGGLAAVAIVATAPLAVPVLIAGATIAGGAVGGAALGEMLGSLSPAMTVEGRIADPCAPNVFVNKLASARAHVDSIECNRHPARPLIAQGSATVFINRQHAARKGDRSACDAVISDGSPNVFIGGPTFTTDDISPEVPGYVHTAMLAVGLASAAILVGPVAALAGLAGGMLGGKLMGDLGGKLFGEGSDGQKVMAFGGALLGGWGLGKGGAWFDRNYQVEQVGLGMNGGGMRVTRRPPATSPQPIQQNEVTTFGDFKDRSVIGDNLEGHEVWQHANLNEQGLATLRLSSDASRNNPVIALDRDTHVEVNRAQRALDARGQTPRENIDANIQILRDLNAAPEQNIDQLHQMATDHAASQGH